MRRIADNNEVYNARPDREYFTIVPNMVMDMELSPYDVRLYCELKRVAGENGKCWMTTKRLAERCGMSVGSVSNSKFKLFNKGLITVKEYPAEIGVYHEIEIVDIWETNNNYCKKGISKVKEEQPRSPYEREDTPPRSPHERARSPHELIKNPVNNIPINEQDSYQDKQPQSLGKEEKPMRSKEELMRGTEEALMRGMIGEKSAYAHYPERLVPVVECMEKYWNFKAPGRKSKQFSFWISSCDEILEACAEFGTPVLDKLHEDWEYYLDNNGGSAPYPISSPKSLLSAVQGKAALMRGGNNNHFWSVKKTEKQSMLDV